MIVHPTPSVEKLASFCAPRVTLTLRLFSACSVAASALMCDCESASIHQLRPCNSCLTRSKYSGSVRRSEVPSAQHVLY